MNGTFRILVVDDNRALAEALQDVFEVKGYEVMLAFDGLQAIERIRNDHFDCVLMDIRMPRMTGVNAFKEIKKLAPSTPVILMTAYSVQGLIEEARSEGVLAILQKPVAPSKILGIVEELNGSSSLLIADPNPDKSLLDALSEKGDRAVVATSSRSAIGMAAAGKYDAVLLSAEIEGVTSSDTVALFREFDPKCLIILMSSEPRDDHNPFIFSSLQKPFKIQDVVSLLEKIRARKVQEKLGNRLFEV